MAKVFRSSTTYGSLGSGLEEEDFERSEENISDVTEPEYSSRFSVIVKPIALASAFLVLSVAALSVSQYYGVDFSLSSSAATLDTTSVTRPVYANLEDYEKEALFRVFVDDYAKMYKTDEYQTKLLAFKDFLVQCDARNMAEANNGGTAVHGITMFADLQDVEFEKYMGYLPTTATLNPTYVSSVDTYTGSDSFVDWSDIYTTSVKSQGYCASCWAFVATEQLESDALRLFSGNGTFSTSDVLSPQQLVSCDSLDGGCNGGDPLEAFEYIIANGGIVTESSYSYTSSVVPFESGDCDSTKNDYVLSLTGYSSLAGSDASAVETNMINYVKSTGPLTVCVDASTWSSYMSGVISVCTSNVNHCVQAVGVNTDEGYWKLRNSWSTSWGESGYVRINLNEDLCGITTSPIFTNPALV